jgi:fucose permease
MASSTLSAKPENRAVGMGLFYTIYYLGGAVVPALCGVAADYVDKPEGGMLAGALLSALAIPAFLAQRMLNLRKRSMIHA